MMNVDEFSMTSASDPFVHMLGAITEPELPYPWGSSTRVEDDPEWWTEHLSDYEVFNGFDFSAEIPLIGENAIGTTGLNLFRAQWDDNGNLKAIAKPLFNQLSSAHHAEEGNIYPTLHWYDNVAHTAFDKLDKPDGDGRYRYILREDTRDVRLPDGSLIQADPSEKILDVTSGGIFVYDSAEQAREEITQLEANEDDLYSVLIDDSFENCIFYNFTSECVDHLMESLNRYTRLFFPHRQVFTNKVIGEYPVAYTFASATPGKELPAKVMKMLPRDDGLYRSGIQINAQNPNALRYETSDGVWTFVGYDAQAKTMSDTGVKFDGTWVFTGKSKLVPPSEEPENPVGEPKVPKNRLPATGGQYASLGALALFCLFGGGSALWSARRKGSE